MHEVKTNGVICANVAMLKLQNIVKYLINDIVTNKPVKFYHPFMSEHDVWMSIHNMISDYVKKSGALPCSFLFKGTYDEFDDFIQLQIGSETFIGFIELRFLACEISLKGLDVLFFDKITHIPVELQSPRDVLVSKISLMAKNVLARGYHGFDVGGDDSIVINASFISRDSNKIVVDGRQIMVFGPKDIVLSVMMDDIRKNHDPG
ncbi:hypothetical protein J6A31_07555 [bacterium]|nr:hypothetical protein [bacterium]